MRLGWSTFETSAGKLTVAGANARTARLDTSGVTGGREINVTCVVVDRYGRKVSYSTMIHLGSGNTVGGLLPAHPPTAVKSSPNAETVELPKNVAPPPSPPPPPAPVVAPKRGVPPPEEAANPPSPQRAGGLLKLRPGHGLCKLLEPLLSASPLRMRERMSMPRGWHFRSGRRN